MKRLVLLLLLGCASTSILTGNAYSAGRCAIEGPEARDAAATYTDLVRTTRDEMGLSGGTSATEILEHVPAFIPLQVKANFENAQNNPHPEVDALVCGFLRPGLGFYQLVPGLGLGVSLSKTDVVYFCVDYGPVEADREVVIYFLEARRLFKEDLTYQKKLVHFSLRPISSTSSLIDAFLRPVPAVGWLYDHFHREIVLTVTAVIREAIDEILRATMRHGVTQVKIKPHEIELTSELTFVLGKFHRDDTIKSIPLESTWLKDAP